MRRQLLRCSRCTLLFIKEDIHIMNVADGFKSMSLRYGLRSKAIWKFEWLEKRYLNSQGVDELLLAFTDTSSFVRRSTHACPKRWILQTRLQRSKDVDVPKKVERMDVLAWPAWPACPACPARPACTAEVSGKQAHHQHGSLCAVIQK